ncbi:hypothetical protein ACQ4PT_023051 [Festuca glaucescens]
MGAEVGEGKNPAEEGTNLADEEVHNNPSEKEDRNPAGQEQIHLLAVAEEETASKKLPLRKNKDKRSELVQVKKEQQLGSSHLTQLPVHREEPASAGVGAMLDKEQIHQLTIAKEDVREEPASEGVGAMLDKEQIHQLAVAEEEAASKKLPLRKNKDKRSELVQVKKEKQLGSFHKTQLPAVAEEPASECLRAMLNKEKIHLLDVAEEEAASEMIWHASYSIRFRKHLPRIYKGSVLLDDEVNRLLLYDIDESFIDEYYLKEGEMIYPGATFEFVKFRIRQAFGDNAAEHLEKVDMTMKSLFEDYSLGESFVDPSEVDVDEVAEIDNPLADWEAHLRVQKKQATNELDRYLSEDLYPQEKDFDILGWWKLHSPEYPVLSCIARDVLAIQASTVASESSFSAGGRTISDQRNRLKSDTVEALICLQDWLKADDPKTTNKDVEEEEYLVFYQESECHEETEPTDN